MYDKKLNEIYNKYEITVLSEDSLNNTLDLVVKGILIDSCAGKKCALWGAGRMNLTSSHAAILIGKYATYLQNLVCVIDSDSSIQGKEFLGYPIIAPEDLIKYDVEVVIISSKNSGKSIIESLLSVAPNQNYVDIYGELRKKNIEVYNNFFDEHSIYTEIFSIQQQLKNIKSSDKKTEFLKQLIYLYLSIKDFYYAFYYIDYYIAKKYASYEKYLKLKNDIMELLKEIKEKNSSREQDISLFYVDALRAKDVYDDTNQLKILESYKNSSQIYTNVYSLGATTYESMVSSILGKYPMECDVYSQNFLRAFDEFEFLKKAEEEQFQINFLVSDCYRLLENTQKVMFNIQIYMSQKLWTLAIRLAESNTKNLSLVYFPYEIHCPMLCGMHKNKPIVVSFSDMGIETFPESLAEQYEECINYMNIQFNFYYDLLGPKTTKVIFSDHSQVVYDKNNHSKSYNVYYKNKELTSHIPFIISKEGQISNSFTGFLSMIDFNQFIIHIIEQKNLNDLERNIVRYQYYPIHSKKIRNHCLQHGFEDYIDGIDIFLNHEMIYIRTGTGKEEVYTHHNLDKNIIQLASSQNFIKEVQKKFGSSPFC